MIVSIGRPAQRLTLTYVTGSIEVEVPPHGGVRHQVVEVSFVPLNETHCCKQTMAYTVE